jgi:hypothetical protein
MIIPDYNKGVINVHMKLSEEDFSLSNENLAAKAFMYLTGLKPTKKITETSWQDVEYQVFDTNSLKIHICCERCDITDFVTIFSSVTFKDKNTKDIIVSFIHAAIGRPSDDTLIPIIDFLYEYKEELFCNSNSVII